MEKWCPSYTYNYLFVLRSRVLHSQLDNYFLFPSSIMAQPTHADAASNANTAMSMPSIMNTFAIIAAIILATLVRRAFFKPTHTKFLPVWTACEIAITTLIVPRGSGLLHSIYSAIRKYGGSLWGLTSSHQVLIDLPFVDRFLSQPHHSLSALPLQFTIHTRVFGNRHMDGLKDKLEISWEEQTAVVIRMFLNDNGAAAAVEKANIPENASSFVTFSDDRQTQKRWEWSAGTRVITPDSPEKAGGAVEVNFENLTRYFGASLSTAVLFGNDFLDRNPTLLDDFWKFDNGVFPLRMMGIPEWLPFKVMREGIAARTRMLKALEDLSRRLDQDHEGQPVDFGADLSDVSPVAVEMNQIYRKYKWTSHQGAVGLFGVFWGQNANANPVLFWFLTFLYSTPGLVEEMRKEVMPYLTLSDAGPLEIKAMDHTGLVRNCCRMKAALYETCRLVTDTTIIRRVERPMTVNDGPVKHELKAGSYISAPLSFRYRDPSLYADPETFDPERFLEQDPETGRLVARYGKLKLWGVGPSMCKGRTFAERELVSLSAAIISLWDVSPATSDGKWNVPAMRFGTGVKRPVDELRVIVKRRVVS